MRSDEATLPDRLVQRLKLLVFFHLGADAIFTCVLKSNGLVASLSHSRIEPFQFEIPSEKLSQMADNLEKVEELFLDLLVKHRRG